MRTTEAERRTAVRLARRLVDTAGIADDVKLLCSTLLDCQDVFAIHAPVISVVKKYITPQGTYGHGWHELVKAVVALHEYDKAEGK